MKLLLDTHAVIWWDADRGRMSPRALAAIQDPANETFISVVSIWEIVIKTRLNKLSIRRPITDFVAEQQANGLRLLGVTLDHVLAVDALPPVHGDPFDRLLAAQAITEGAEFVTADAVFARYPARVFW